MMPQTQTSDSHLPLPDLSRGVLHVITGLHTGGAEAQLVNLALANHRAGIAVVVASLIPGGVHRQRLADAGVATLDLGMRRGHGSALAPLTLARLIRRCRPAVVQSWMYHADLLATLGWLLSGRWRATRLIWGVRCSNLDIGRYRPALRRVMSRCARLSRLPSAIVTNSAAGRRAHEVLGYRTRHFAVIENGIDTARFKPDAAARANVRRDYGLDADTPLIAIVARVDPMKDYLTFIQALDRLDGVHALAIGEGTEGLGEIERMISLGRRDDVPRLLAACDVVVSSSAFGEGFSNAIAEGMACGLPAVATEVGDAARIVGDCGRLVPTRDPPALAEAVRALLDDDPAALGVRARARVENEFSVPRMVASFNALHGIGV
jgi:glycosyltransferase involved in cell wall biosynthesis